MVLEAEDADQVPNSSTYCCTRGSRPVNVPANPDSCAVVVGAPPEATDSYRTTPLTCSVNVDVAKAVQVIRACTYHGAVTDAVGV